jgi:hypothetical protein
MSDPSAGSSSRATGASPSCPARSSPSEKRSSRDAAQVVGQARFADTRSEMSPLASSMLATTISRYATSSGPLPPVGVADGGVPASTYRSTAGGNTSSRTML